MIAVTNQNDRNTTVEREWMGWLETLPEPRLALQRFARQYHYFSLRQVIAFSRLLAVIPLTDRAALALFADVLYEELGRAQEQDVHSIVFERFAQAIGVPADSLPLASGDVVGGVRWYVCELELAFGGRSLARALATYVFLESAAVETYGPLLERLQSLGIAAEALEFFKRHADVEIEHAAAAERLVERAKLSGPELEEFRDQTRLLQRCWQTFWQDIWDDCRQAVS